MPGDDLVRRAQRGDVRALEQLCEREWRPVYAIVYASTRNQLVAEDLTQEVFLRALKAFNRYEDRYVPFRAFLATVARNLVRNRWRRHVPVRVGLDSAPELQSNAPGQEENAMVHSDLGHLADVFATLSDDYQLVLQLRVLEGLPANDVAERMQRSPAASATSTQVWSVAFPQGMAPDGCPALGNSVCNSGATPSSSTRTPATSSPGRGRAASGSCRKPLQTPVRRRKHRALPGSGSADDSPVGCRVLYENASGRTTSRCDENDDALMNPT